MVKQRKVEGSCPKKITHLEKHSEDETPLADMLVNIKKINLKRKATSTKEGSSSKDKTKQGKVKKQPLITKFSSKPSSSIRQSERLNKTVHEQPRQSPEFVVLEKE